MVPLNRHSVLGWSWKLSIEGSLTTSVLLPSWTGKVFNYPPIPEPNYTIFTKHLLLIIELFVVHTFLSPGFYYFVSGSEVLIHFDSWSSDYDYWCPPDVVELHPPGWCHRNSWELITPRGSCCMYIPHCYSTNNNSISSSMPESGWATRFDFRLIV